MLQTIREYVQGWIAGTIISVIILTFALWGIHSYFTGNVNTNIAEVNGVDITKEQFTLAYERLRRQAQTQYGLPTSAKDETTLKSRALKALIDVEVLKQASIAEGFNISSAQIDSYLQSMPEFQVDGQFSIQRFQELLSATLMSTGDFLDVIKTSLLIEQPRLGVILTSFALPSDVKATMTLVDQVRDISYINIPLSFFLSQPIVIPADKIQAYYDEHKAEYMTPEQVRVEYIELSLNNLMTRFNPTEAMLKNFYNENVNAYVKVDEATKQPKIQPYEAVKDKVREGYVRQHAEEKFSEMRDQLADLTYEHPESLKAASDALILPIQTSDMFTRAKAEKDIAQFKRVRDTAFSNDVLELQNNSDVIQLSPDRVVVIRLKEHTPSSQLPLSNVSAQIEAKLKAQEAESRAETFARNFKDKLETGADPQQLATSYQFKWTQGAKLGRYAKSVDSAILDMAFRLPNPAMLKKKVTYGVTRLPNGYAIIALNSVQPGSIADTKQNAVFAEQVQNSLGVLEYELYKRSQLQKAKIIVN